MPKEELYIGAKIISGFPMRERDFLSQYREMVSSSARDGYRVTHPDGYISWSPKDTFENAYRLIIDEEIALIV